MKAGDLVQTVVGWSYKTWTGIVLKLEVNKTTREGWAKVLWTEASRTDGQIFWQPTSKLEILNESR